MTTTPSPPAGAVALERRRLAADRGEVARWCHTPRLPHLEVSLRSAGEFGGYPEQPATARVSTWPGQVTGITDPAELRQMAWVLLDAARWLDRQTPRAPAEPHPQTTIYDHLETTA